MTLTVADVNRIAELSCLELTSAERDVVLDELNHIFTMVETMQNVDTSGVEPMTHPHDQPLFLRDDEGYLQGDVKAMQQNAPYVENGLYLVPKVVE